MPHILLSVSGGVPVDFDQVLQSLVDELSSTESVESKSIKAYGQVFDDWKMGLGAKGSFVHCEVRVLIGRTEDWRMELADRMFPVLMRAFAANSDVQFTLEIREMERTTYRKG